MGGLKWYLNRSLLHLQCLHKTLYIILLSLSHTHTHTHTRMPEEPPFVKLISTRSSLNKRRLWVIYIHLMG